MTTRVPHQLLDIPTLEIVNRRFVGDTLATYPASWSNVELNTILLDEIGGISISGGFQIIGLPAGKYVVSCIHAHYNAGHIGTRLYDATNVSELARSVTGYSVSSDAPNLVLGPRKITVTDGAAIAYQVLATSGLRDTHLNVQASHEFYDYGSIRFERVS